mgnify:FL=1
MKVADKIKIDDKEYMCTQIFLLEGMKTYRVQNVLEGEELFLNDNYEVITDESILNEIYKIFKVEDGDILIKY